MPDKSFYHPSGSLSIQQLENISGSKCVHYGAGDPERVFSDVGILNFATPKDVSFFHNKNYLEAFQNSNAGLIFCSPEFADQSPRQSAVLVSSTPYRAYAMAAAAFYPNVEQSFISAQNEAISKNASIADDVVIEPGVVIQENVVIETGCRIGANTVIRRGVRIGSNCTIGDHVSLACCILGKGIVIYPGARIGQAGFGFFMDEKGHVTVPQLGRVLIEDGVEIGANTTIDRGTLEDTVVGAGTRIDNLVQLGHNVKTGKHCVLVAQVGIAGSTTLGNYVIAAGQAGLAGHLKIGDGVRIAAQSGIYRDLEPGLAVAGCPGVPITQWHRQTIALSRLAQAKKKDL